MPKIITLQDCVEFAMLKNGKCLSTQYISSKDKLLWQCKNNHIWQASFGNIKHRHSWCPFCIGLAKLTIEDCREYALTKNGKCLSATYINTREYLLWECPNGHQWLARFNNIKTGYWCPNCGGSIKLTTKEYKQRLIDINSSLEVIVEYINMDTKIVHRCKNCQFEFEAKPRDTYHLQSGCPKCCKHFSKMEKDLFMLIKEYFPDAQENTRGLLENKHFELDIYIPSLNKGVEFDGAYWHSSQESNSRDFRKNEECRKIGIELFRVDEQSWKNNKEIIFAEVLEFLMEKQYEEEFNEWDEWNNFFTKCNEYVSMNLECWNHFTLLAFFLIEYKKLNGIDFIVSYSKNGPKKSKELKFAAMIWKMLDNGRYKKIQSKEEKKQYKHQLVEILKEYIVWGFKKFSRSSTNITGLGIFISQNFMNEFLQWRKSISQSMPKRSDLLPKVFIDWVNEYASDIYTKQQLKVLEDLNALMNYVETYDEQYKHPEYDGFLSIEAIVLNKAVELGIMPKNGRLELRK